MIANCKRCKWSGGWQGELGECRRYPPRIVDVQSLTPDIQGQTAIFPPVVESDGCGEFVSGPGFVTK